MGDTDRNTALEQQIKNIEHELEKLGVEAESQKQLNKILLDANDGLMNLKYDLESEIAKLKHRNEEQQHAILRLQSEIGRIRSELEQQKSHPVSEPNDHRLAGS